MEQIKFLERVIKFPDNVTIEVNNERLKVTGPKGTTEKRLTYPGINIQVQNKKLSITSKKYSKKGKRIVGTFESHILNLIHGVTSGYFCKLKICSGHFPMKVTLEPKKVIISNFLGEKIPRKAKILEGAQVSINNDIIVVEGIDKEKTGQTAANIERATRITKRGRRVFQDGIYLVN